MSMSGITQRIRKDSAHVLQQLDMLTSLEDGAFERLIEEGYGDTAYSKAIEFVTEGAPLVHLEMLKHEGLLRLAPGRLGHSVAHSLAQCASYGPVFEEFAKMPGILGLRRTIDNKSVADILEARKGMLRSAKQ